MAKSDELGPHDIVKSDNCEAWFYFTRSKRSIDVVVRPMSGGKPIIGSGRIIRIPMRLIERKAR